MLLFLVPHALAQGPIPFQLPVADAAARWIVAETSSVRFFGENLPGPEFMAGEQVQVILEDQGQARVRAGDRYGWVPSASLTAEAPASALPTVPPPDGSLLGGVPARP